MNGYRALMKFDLLNNLLRFTIPSSFINRFTNPQGDATNCADMESYRASMKPYTKKPPHATPEDERYLHRGVWHTMKSRPKPPTYSSLSSCFFSPRWFSPRSKAIKQVDPAPAAPPAATAIQGIVDYTTAIPREIRDHIHANALPEVILVRDGVIDPSVGKFFVNRQVYNQCREVVQRHCFYKIECSSTSNLMRILDNIPTGGLALFKRVITTATGPYNSHAPWSTDGNHSDNICPTMYLNNGRVSFSIEFACSSCKSNRFYPRELN
jgi:hypothetical protein